MKTETDLKNLVKEKYGEIASGQSSGSSCCGPACCSPETANIMAEDYSKLQGYQPDADLGLGCGIPTELAAIKEGDVVIDLGSGAGNDCFIARAATGSAGRVIGIDFTPAMIEKARRNNAALGFDNVEFRQGDIESMPVEDSLADVVLSNCVLNLVPNKASVFKEIFRVLKGGGHFCISDIVLAGELPGQLKEAAEMYVGCVSGAIQKEHYLELIRSAGFDKIAVQKERRISLPDDLLSHYLQPDQLAAYREGVGGIYSITVSAAKPVEKACCTTDCCK